MIKKLALTLLSAALLGGCTLGDAFKTGDAAMDTEQMPVATTTPTPTSSPDISLNAVPSTSNSTEVTSIEKDINNTKILDEDFSDLN